MQTRSSSTTSRHADRARGASTPEIGEPHVEDLHGPILLGWRRLEPDPGHAYGRVLRVGDAAVYEGWEVVAGPSGGWAIRFRLVVGPDSVARALECDADGPRGLRRVSVRRSPKGLVVGRRQAAAGPGRVSRHRRRCDAAHEHPDHPAARARRRPVGRSRRRLGRRPVAGRLGRAAGLRPAARRSGHGHVPVPLCGHRGPRLDHGSRRPRARLRRVRRTRLPELIDGRFRPRW